MRRSFNFWTRKMHRWGALLCCIPLLLVIITGILLQVKKQVPWVQPATQNAGHSEVAISWDQILESAMADPQAEVTSWDDIDRLDVRPGKGVLKIRCQNSWELQLDLKTAEILSSKYRRSDLIESLHDGSFFGDASKLGVFLINGVVLLGLWVTGIWLWWLPIKVKRAKRRKRQSVQSKSQPGDGA
ncbi:MAG: PepSY domain-containing protein [Planctomycetaceae bacterium]|nr:PepSY domain-containing protein [Planctomycetaceae bacterium]